MGFVKTDGALVTDACRRRFRAAQGEPDEGDMGIVICMTALPPIDANVVKQEIQVIASRKGGHFRTAAAPSDGASNLIFGQSENGSITIIYPRGFDHCDQASQHLSTTLKSPAFSLKLDNNDGWWAYKLYANGVEVDRFSPWEDYFLEEEGDRSGNLYKGDPKAVISHWGVGTVTGIERYYGFKSAKNCDQKAYPTDEVTQCDEWQLVDFMRKLGLAYPVDEKGHIHGEQYTFSWGTR